MSTTSQANLVEYNRQIARWTRLSGSAEERSAAAYAEEQLRAAGYRTHIAVHDAYISLPGPASLAITHPAPRELFCITHSMGRSTGPDGVAADLVDVGKGRREDYERAGARGRRIHTWSPFIKRLRIHSWMRPACTIFSNTSSVGLYFCSVRAQIG